MNRFTPLRRYIFDRLYHPTQGYFCKPNFQVGQLHSPIDFKNLIGYDDYQRQLHQKYPAHAWLTPCQIFKPYYGMTIANYLKAAHQRYFGQESPKHKLRIVQAGAGTGSAAESILYFFTNYHRQLLPLIDYSIVEISPSLCKRIDQKLSKSYGPLLKKKQIKIINQDISDFKEAQPCFVLFFQVLDNMPHDKVLWNQTQQIYDRYVTVNIDTNQESSMDIANDHLIKESLDLYSSLGRQHGGGEGVLDRIAHFFVLRMANKTHKPSRDLFLPTFMLKLLKKTSKNIPKCNFVISDFDHLVTPVPGINAPIVSKKLFKSDQKLDFDSYLIERGEADIFFPVNFPLLQKMHEQVLGKKAKVVKSYEFVSEFGFDKWAQTKSTFNPIRQDFGNTSFLVTDIPKKQ